MREEASVLILGESGTGKELVAREIHKRSELDEPVGPGVDQMRITATAHYKLIRGENDIALAAFRTLLEESRFRFEPQATGGHCAAAAACLGLGDGKAAERHYQNAVPSFELLSEPFKIALHASRLHVLARLRGRGDDVRDWLARIQSLSISPAMTAAFLEAARLFATASSRSASSFVPA